MIITLSREFGAGGGLVARRVAAALGWRVVDNELIDQIADRSGLTPEEVAEREERAPGFVERLVRALSKAAPEIQAAPSDDVPELEEAKLVRVTEAVVADASREGRVVLVGRAASAVLGGERDALHVKVVAPRQARIDAIVSRTGCTPDQAAAEVARSDSARARYHEFYYGRDWRDASKYHLVLNTAALGIDQTVDTIVGRAKIRWPHETLERRSTRP
ncbi:MAG: cytidylate kinase-like family protein [Gemmatimonadales bacterium]|nr:cytidylate kinase-like family protein [Gemmatimonadales bacterium]